MLVMSRKLLAIVDVNGSDSLGFRICSIHPFNDFYNGDPLAICTALLAVSKDKDLAYVHEMYSLRDSNIDVLNLINL